MCRRNAILALVSCKSSHCTIPADQLSQIQDWFSGIRIVCPFHVSQQKLQIFMIIMHDNTFIRACSNSTMANGFKLEEGRLRLDIGNTFLSTSF